MATLLGIEETTICSESSPQSSGCCGRHIVLSLCIPLYARAVVCLALACSWVISSMRTLLWTHAKRICTSSQHSPRYPRHSHHPSHTNEKE